MRKIVLAIAIVVVLGGVYLYLLVLCPALNPFYLVVFTQNHFRTQSLFDVKLVISDYFKETGRMPEDLTQLFDFLETRHPNDKRAELKEWAKKSVKYKTNATRDEYFMFVIGNRPWVKENVAVCWNGDFYCRLEEFAWFQFHRFGENEAGSVVPGKPSGPGARGHGRERRVSPGASANRSLNGG